MKAHHHYDFPHSQGGKPYLWVELPIIDYREAWNLQHHLVAARNNGILNTDTVLLLEHFPVFTLGHRGEFDNVVISKGFLKKSGIPVLQVERGGNITFHGPGQLIAYPIINLSEAMLTVLDYITGLEEVMIRTAADWHIEAGRNPLNPGVWVRENKLGSIGIAIRHGVSFHGCALNVNLSLKPFEWIKPCGLQGIGMTSMERELSIKISTQEVRAAFKRHMQAVFGVDLIVTSFSELHGLLKIPA